MTHNPTHSGATSAVMSWAAQTSNMPSVADEEIGDVDEPPDSRLPYSPMKSTFSRNPIRNSVDMHHHQSLLTRALHHDPEDEHHDARSTMHLFGLRRSTTSNASLASTADLTSDTGMTSPSRTNTPSPPLPELRFLKLNNEPANAAKQAPTSQTEEPKKVAPPKKRCIQFACAAKPTEKPLVKPVEAPKPQLQIVEPKPEAPRKRCIKFACPAPRPVVNNATPPQQVQRLEAAASRLQPPTPDSSPATVRKHRYSSSHSRSPRPPMVRRSSREPAHKPMPSKKYITVEDKDLLNEASRFHEFASDDHCDEDWIRESVPAQGRKITVNDTLAKENEIRKIATEVEEEAEDEENDDETTVDDDDDLGATAGEEDDDDDEDDDEYDDDIDDGLSGYITEDEDDDSVGYHTDEETGFADSDDEADDDLQLWTPAQPALRLSGLSSATPVARRASITGPQSDSSLGSISSVRAVRSGKARRIKIRPGTPELPDSTDFVCGTLDEDRPMEDAYMSCLAARRREKLHLIPQDIDPSFPASEPEDNGEEELYNPVKHASDDEDVWLHGEMDDLDHQQERRSRKKKSEHSSPKRYHSPPPKRFHSPPPKTRGRSPPPKRLFDRRSPCRMRSPAPQMIRSPPASLRTGPQAIAFKELASRPGLTMTKSLPRPAAWANMRNGRRNKALMPNADDNDVHIRSAIDIVKGLEQKRQRRKEKYYQKYCNRARKGQKPERKPMPGMGCVRMRELGLIMAGKIDQGNYVLSI
ncbi:hypothetical protein ACHAQA_008096 [Verticillium albo-atrum]